MSDPLSEEIAQLINRLDRLVRSGESSRGHNPAQWEALRYLARANRFSRTPAALADFLGSTRGTVSQTLIALEQKGYVARRQSLRDKRSVDLELTRQGCNVLESDPLDTLASDIAVMQGIDLAAVASVLREALARAILRNGGRPLGVCHTCRHFERALPRGKDYAHCNLLNEPLSETDSNAICTEQSPKAC